MSQLQVIPTPPLAAYIKHSLQLFWAVLRLFATVMLMPFLAIYQAIWPKSIDRSVKPHAMEYFWRPRANARRAVLFVHGFSSNPEIFRDYAEMFLARGYVVQAVRIEGHGTSPEDFATTNVVDWYLSVRTRFLELQEKVDDVIILAHSLGTLLSLMLASNFRVHSMVLLSSPIKIRRTPMFRAHRLLRPLSKVVKYWPSDQRDSPVMKERGFTIYPVHPLAAVAGLFDAETVAQHVLPKVTCPVLAMVGDQDEFVDTSTLEYLKEHLGSSVMEQWVAPDATHLIIDTTELATLEGKIEQFVLQYSPPTYA